MIFDDCVGRQTDIMTTTTDILYENYPYDIQGERKDAKLNKGILSLAKRHKFYIPQINYILNPKGFFGFGRPIGFQVVVAKKKNKTNDNYKVVGFIIFKYGDVWGEKGEFCLASLEYWLVDKAFQGQGIGKTLYEWMERKNECSNFKVMFDKTNVRLCDLYTKLGYKLIKKYDGKEVINKEADNHITWVKICFHSFNYGGKLEVVYESDVAD